MALLFWFFIGRFGTIGFLALVRFSVSQVCPQVRYVCLYGMHDVLFKGEELTVYSFL